MNTDAAGLLVDSIAAFAALVAIGYAVRAQQGTNRLRQETIDKRTRLFELEILREILRDIDNGLLLHIAGDPRRLRQFTWRIDFLPTSELPSWRRLLTMNWQDEVSQYAGFKEAWMAKSIEIFESAKRAEGLTGSELAAWELRHDRLTTEVA